MQEIKIPIPITEYDVDKALLMQHYNQGVIDAYMYLSFQKKMVQGMLNQYEFKMFKEPNYHIAYQQGIIDTFKEEIEELRCRK